MFEHVHPRCPNSGLKFQVPILDPVVPCLSVCWKRHDNSASTQVPKFRSQFQNTKFKIIKTSSSISSFGKSRPNSRSSNYRSNSKIRSHLEFSFSSSSLFCFDESNLTHYPLCLPLFRSQFHILISSPQIQVLIFPFSSSSPFL
jgi:hypothetical protein